MADANQKDGRTKFDEWMKKFSHKRLLSVLDIEQIKQAANFTVSRLAYWVKTQGKMIANECINFFNNYGLIGVGRAQLTKSNFA